MSTENKVTAPLSEEQNLKFYQKDIVALVADVSD